MSQTPNLAVNVVRSIPSTASDIGYDPFSSGSPDTDVQAELDRLEALIAASPSGNFLTSNYGEQAILVTVATSGAAYTIDVSSANSWDITVSEACTLSLSNPAPPGVDSHIEVNLRGNFAVTFPGSLTFYDPLTGLATTAPDFTTLDPDAQTPMEWDSVDGGVSWGCELPAAFVTYPSGTFATPAIVLGTAAAAGAATTVIRSDSTIVAFDATVPTNVAGVGVASSTGSVAKAARRDHGHALTYHDEPLTDGASNFIFDGGDIVVVTGVPN